MAGKSLAILGAGTFGLSTALAWRRVHPSAVVSLIDVKASPLGLNQPNPNNIIPASEDVGKIIRAAYVSPEYAELAREALEIWRSESPYKEYFHQSGWVVANELKEEYLSITEGKPIRRERFEEAFPGSNLDDGFVISEDAGPGWVEASRCLEAVLRKALDQGVEYFSGEAVSLVWSGSRCTGIKMKDGKEINADNVILATGPWTPSFLKKCGVSASIPCEVAGVTALGVELDKAEYETYKDMPVLAVPGTGDVSVTVTVLRKRES
jgi:glycine/D-amino acid oxidase-like deaminating enzyme